MIRRASGASPSRALPVLLVAALFGMAALAPAGAAPGDPATKKFVRSLVKSKLAKVKKRLSAAEVEVAGRLHGDISAHTASSPDSSDTPKSIEAACPAGKLAVGGGAWLSGGEPLGLADARVALQASQPTGSPPTRWMGVGAETAGVGASWQVHASVICATP